MCAESSFVEVASLDALLPTIWPSVECHPLLWKEALWRVHHQVRRVHLICYPKHGLINHAKAS